MSDVAPTTVDGRVPGRRGLATRQRLTEATRVALEEQAYRDVTVAEIARRAGTSPGTFYQYFSDVEAAVLDLAADVAARGGVELAPLVADDRWGSSEAVAAAGVVVDGFLDFWRRHGAVIRVMDARGRSSGGRFAELRALMLVDFNDALSTLIAVRRDAAGEDGSPESHPADASLRGAGQADLVDPRAVAGAMTSMLAHVADHLDGFTASGITPADTRAAMVDVLTSTVAGGGRRR